jgi:hypothetical protein
VRSKSLKNKSKQSKEKHDAQFYNITPQKKKQKKKQQTTENLNGEVN